LAGLLVGVLILSLAGCTTDSAPAARSLYATSRFESKVTQFTIEPNGLLTPKHPPSATTGGGFDDSLGVAISPDGTALYVADGPSNSESGPAPFPGTISQFYISPLDGTLVPMDPPTVPASFNPIQIVITPDGQFAYVANEGSAEVGQYRVNADKTLTPLSPATVFTSRASDMVVTPDSRTLYVTNEEIPGTVSQYDIAANGTLSPETPFTVPAEQLSLGIVVSPSGKNAYVANRGSAAVSQYAINADGTLTPLTPPFVAAGAACDDLGISPDGAHVYALNSLDNTISQYSVAADGTLHPLNPPTVDANGWQPREMVITADGLYAYVANKALADGAPPGNIAMFAIQPDGTLVPLDPPIATAGPYPRGLVIGFRF